MPKLWMDTGIGSVRRDFFLSNSLTILDPSDLDTSETKATFSKK
jgi:hypothetical protein